MYAICGLAFAFYLFRIPERFLPGTFDILGRISSSGNLTVENHDASGVLGPHPFFRIRKRNAARGGFGIHPGSKKFIDVILEEKLSLDAICGGKCETGSGKIVGRTTQTKKVENR
jgi:hypothetical protein